MDSSLSLETYRFPADKLKQRQTDPSKTPLVLVACGSFSPPTYLHLRMFEMASDYVKYSIGEFELMGGFLSPVTDAYEKVGLAPAKHRIRMCRRALETSDWLATDPWEPLQSSYVPTAQVLEHFDYEINTVHGGVELPDGSRRRVRIALLAGADLIQTMSTPGLWSEEDLDTILGAYGAFIIERTGTDIDEALVSLRRWERNIWVISQAIQNDISSTKVRLFLKKDLSVKYLLPDSVVGYIVENHLYGKSLISADQTLNATAEKEKEKEKEQEAQGPATQGT